MMKESPHFSQESSNERDPLTSVRERIEGIQHKLDTGQKSNGGSPKIESSRQKLTLISALLTSFTAGLSQTASAQSATFIPNPDTSHALFFDQNERGRFKHENEWQFWQMRRSTTILQILFDLEESQDRLKVDPTLDPYDKHVIDSTFQVMRLFLQSRLVEQRKRLISSREYFVQDSLKGAAAYQSIDSVRFWMSRVMMSREYHNRLMNVYGNSRELLNARLRQLRQYDVRIREPEEDGRLLSEPLLEGYYTGEDNRIVVRQFNKSPRLLKYYTAEELRHNVTIGDSLLTDEQVLLYQRIFNPIDTDSLSQDEKIEVDQINDYYGSPTEIDAKLWVIRHYFSEQAPDSLKLDFFNR